MTCTKPDAIGGGADELVRNLCRIVQIYANVRITRRREYRMRCVILFY
jgi:hypothetical protein